MIEAAILARLVTEARIRRAVEMSLSAEREAFADARRRTHELAIARTRWLHDHGAEASFPCGVTRPLLPEGWDGTSLRDRRTEVQVIAAVLPEAIAFLVEPPPSLPSWDPIEAGSIRRDSIRSVEVVDTAGDRVPEPASESFDPEPEVELVIGWDGDPGEQRMTFRSAWLAWQAARRLLGLRLGPTT